MQKIEISNLSKRFGNKLLFRSINAVFTSGVHGIAGPNGSGKSTLLKCIIGLQKPGSGRVDVSVNGETLSPGERLIKVGFSGPYINLYSELTVLENLQFLSRLLDKPSVTASDMLDRLAISDIGDQLVGSLSSGQQQRVRIASALIKDSPILFLDEPGSNLDRDGNDMIASVLDDSRAANRLVLLATNQQTELDLCDEILHINDFKI
ncbi:MAG: ATP-binding cassette domain-containing protein [Rhodothermaceae bacterium]|nr:ATP-binding cassette domain-containing protein [Rhodothermaceae bacterium]